MSQRFRLEESGLVIRSYEPRDQDQVWSLHLEGLWDTGAFYPDARPEWDDDLRHVQEIYLKEGCHFWVVEESGKVIAMTAILGVDAESGRLRRMRVAANRRRTGIGQRLLDIAEQFCRQHGYKRIVLDTSDRQQAARRLYEKNGYTLTGERPLGPLRIFFYQKELE